MTRAERIALEGIHDKLQTAYDGLKNDLPCAEDKVLHERVQVLFAKIDVSDMLLADSRKRNWRY
jgi:hypothetical protein